MMENTYGVEEPKLLSTSSPVVSSGMVVLEGQASCVAEYIVRRRAVLRKSHNLSSEKLGELSVGEIVAVTHKVGNRMRCHRLSWRQDSGSVTVGWASECLDDGQGEWSPYFVCCQVQHGLASVYCAGALLCNCDWRICLRQECRFLRSCLGPSGPAPLSTNEQSRLGSQLCKACVAEVLFGPGTGIPLDYAEVRARALACRWHR